MARYFAVMDVAAIRRDQAQCMRGGLQQLPHTARTFAVPLSDGSTFAAPEYVMSNPNNPAKPNPSQTTPAKPEHGKDEHNQRNPQHASEGEGQQKKEGQPNKQDQSNR